MNNGMVMCGCGMPDTQPWVIRPDPCKPATNQVIQADQFATLVTKPSELAEVIECVNGSCEDDAAFRKLVMALVKRELGK